MEILHLPWNEVTLSTGRKVSADSTAPDPFKQTLADYIEAERLTLDGSSI